MALRTIFARCAAVVIVLTLLAAPQALASGIVTTTFQSQFGWSTYRADPAAGGVLVGPSEEVCLNAIHPRCSNGGVSYGFTSGGWFLDLSAFPLAHFMWAPRVNGQTSSADLATFAFSRTFFLPGTPVAGTLRIAADDFAEVRVNGIVIGSIGSVTDIYLAGDAQSYLHVIDLTPYLQAGSNTVTIVAQNGPASFPGCPQACAYAQNPAMVIFAGTLVSQT